MNSSKTWTPGIFSEASEAEYSSKHFGGPTYKALNKSENNSAPESQPKLVLQFTSTASIYSKIVPQYLMLQVCQQMVIFSKKKDLWFIKPIHFVQPLLQRRVLQETRVHVGSLVLMLGQGKSNSNLTCYETDLPTGKVCIQRLLLDVSFMGMRDGANGFISARWGVYPPGRMCSMDSALPTWNLPGALESRCWDSSMFSRTSRKHNLKSAWDHAEAKQKRINCLGI